MNVQYHPASNDAVRRLDLPCAVRSTALPLRKAGRVARGAILALLFFLFYAGTQNAGAQVLVFEDAELRITSDYGVNFGPIDGAATQTHVFTIENKTGGTLVTADFTFTCNSADFGSALTSPIIADGTGVSLSLKFTPGGGADDATCDIRYDLSTPTGANLIVGQFDVHGDPSPFAPGQDLTISYDGTFTLVMDQYGNPLAVNDRKAPISVTAENVLIDWTGGNPLPTSVSGLSILGSGTTSTLTMDGNLLSSLLTEVDHEFLNENDGEIRISPGVGDPFPGVDRFIFYDNLKPINDYLLAQIKTFDYSGVTSAPDHDIFLDGDSDSGGMGNGISFIDCVACGEEVSFTNPLTRINIYAGLENDTVTIESIDMPIPPTFVGVYAYGGDPVGTPDGDDRFVVTPNTLYEIYVDGDDQSVTTGCFGDILDVVLTGVSGAELDIAIPGSKQGTWSFDVPHKAVNFTDIEGHDDADVSLELDVTPELVYATDFKNVVITVENTGSDQAACVAVEVPASLMRIFSEDDFAIDPVEAMTDENDVAFAGLPNLYTLTDSTWTIGYMGPGFTATLSAMGLVSNFKRMPEQFPITASTDGVEESVLFETHPGFRFPLTTFVNSAAYVTKQFDGVPQPTADVAPGNAATVNRVVFDVLVAGLFQGAPGITGAVWCKIPDAIFVDRTLGGGDPYSVDNNVIWPGDNAVDGADPFPASAPENLDPPSSSLGDLWRPCSGTASSKTDANPYEAGVQTGIELPFPLHVNGLYFDLIREDPGTGTFTPPLVPEVEAVLWLATWGSAGLYKSYDGGETWLAAWPELGPGDASTGTYWTNIYAITEDEAGFLYASANDGYVLRSLNHGLTWQTVGSLPHVDSDTPWSLHGDLDEPGVVYAGTFGRGLYFTTDYGYTWEELDNLATVANENQALYSAPNNAGHIFEIEIWSNGTDNYIFVGTGNGVWRAKLNSANHALASSWVFLGPEVKLQDNTFVRPEVHALVMIPEGFLNSDNFPSDGDLLAGLWGNFLVGGDLYSAEMFDEPFGNPIGPTPLYAPYVLRGRQVSAIAVASDGTVAVVTDKGLVVIPPQQASTSTSTEPVTGELPSEYTLDQNYPNPFNPVTTIRFAVPETGKIRLAVYDVLGRQVAILVDGALQAGQHEVQFNAAGLPSGTYVYRLQTAAGSLSKTLVLMK